MADAKPRKNRRYSRSPQRAVRAGDRARCEVRKSGWGLLQELSDQLAHVWTMLRDDVDSVNIKDPANPTGNDLSELLDEAAR
jgi:hypothetical protein